VVARLRREERERRARWRVVLRHWDDLVRGNPMPKAFNELPANVQTFVVQVLQPMLSDDEKKRLAEAEGLWPDYPRTLVELADNHPVRLLGSRGSGPRTYDDLPPETKATLPGNFRKNPPPAVKKAEGNWPDYLIAVAEWAARNKGKKGKDVVLP